MKQAILIIAHGKPSQLNKLIEFFDSDLYDIFIHYDIKSKDYIKDIFKPQKSHLEVFSEFDIRWGTYAMSKCELFLLEKALAHGSYKYFHLLSAQDLPLRPLKKIYSFFDKSDKEFVHFQSKELTPRQLSYIKYSHPLLKYPSFKDNKILNKADKVTTLAQKVVRVNKIRDAECKFYRGAQWFSITQDFAKYVVSKADFIEKYFKKSRNSDECFLQTVLMNSKYKNRLYYDKMDDNYIACMRDIDWHRGAPYTWQLADYDELISSDYMFARKFDERVDSKIIDKIYKTIS